MSWSELREAECLYSRAAVDEAIAAMGATLTRRLAGADWLAVCLLQGGIVPAGQLLPHIDAALQLDAVDITRYRDTTEGGTLDWRFGPRNAVAGRRVLLLDDILDEGHSLAAVRRHLLDAGAVEVLIAVLVVKRHDRGDPHVRADFFGLEVPDRYVFGYGMDYRGWYRNAPGIYAWRD